MRLWIIECDHEPMKGVPFFRDDPVSTEAMKKCLNSIPVTANHYVDAVLYERIETKQLQNLESEG